MASNEFKLRIIGEDVSPETVDTEDLFVVIMGIRTAVTSIAKTDGVSADEIFLSLPRISGLSTGGNEMLLHGSPQSIEPARHLVSSISESKVNLLPAKARQSLRDIWKLIFARGWDACEVSGNGSAIGTAAIKKEKELFPQPGSYRGETVLYGKCVRVGGESRKTATIVLLTCKYKTVRLKTRELALQLGKRLYQTVGLKGEAIWQSKPEELIEFRADSLTDFKDRDQQDDPRPRSVMSAFESLAKATGGRWDNIDPDKFTQDVRVD